VCTTIPDGENPLGVAGGVVGAGVYVKNTQPLSAEHPALLQARAFHAYVAENGDPMEKLVLLVRASIASLTQPPLTWCSVLTMYQLAPVLACHVRTTGAVVTAEAMARNSQLLATDYQHVDKPDVLLPKNGKIEMSGRALANYKIQRQVDEMLQPELDRSGIHADFGGDLAKLLPGLRLIHPQTCEVRGCARLEPALPSNSTAAASGARPRKLTRGIIAPPYGR